VLDTRVYASHSRRLAAVFGRALMIENACIAGVVGSALDACLVLALVSGRTLASEGADCAFDMFSMLGWYARPLRTVLVSGAVASILATGWRIAGDVGVAADAVTASGGVGWAVGGGTTGFAHAGTVSATADWTSITGGHELVASLDACSDWASIDRHEVSVVSTVEALVVHACLTYAILALLFYVI